MYSIILYTFLNIHNWIYDLQFGFREHRSTNHALLSLSDALDGNNFVCGVFIDLPEAFDTMDHNILLKKLYHYGISGKANECFNSYLSNRSQFVSINGFATEAKNINIGVPQGPVLGPLPFLVYINDLHNAIKFSKVRHC